MTTEISAKPWKVVWSTDPRDPCMAVWKHNQKFAKWQAWHRFETEGDARAAACANGLSQYEPTTQEVQRA